ncbi:ATP-grasp domain-containing protein [Tunturiibacter lichenicola]|uniref:ATP-grasp domain-containing protein n=1 Tax=Tunturiibacter lichenicola TaxID=2051959 RepID=UPI0021B4B112|nr:ATP-grasp domain-containing protein [Edaphobacter lichenicola]
MSQSDSCGKDYAQSSLLIISSVWWPSSAKLAVALANYGCKVEGVCPPDHPFSFVDGITKIYPYRGLDSLQSLYDAICQSQPYLLIPCDDGVVWQLHELHRTRPELRPLIERSLGAPSGYELLSGRAELLQLAQEMHIRVPRTIQIANPGHLEEYFSSPAEPAILKLDGTNGGKGVQVVHSLQEARRAFTTMLRPVTLLTAVGRWLVIHDALALWNRTSRRRPGLVLQQFIAGRPANTMMVCQHGKVLAMVTVEVLCAQGSTGAAMAVRLIENEEICTAAERIAERLQLSGFHGLDFVLESETGYAYLIEMNPRCTQLGHLPLPLQGDLAGIFCRAFTDANPQQQQRSFCEKTIVFFPQAIMSNAKFPYLQTSYVDVPWGEPRLVRELMNRDWRDRSFFARLHNMIWPPVRAAVDFEAMAGQSDPIPEMPTVGPKGH